jgi:hypothetical protein
MALGSPANERNPARSRRACLDRPGSCFPQPMNHTLAELLNTEIEAAEKRLRALLTAREALSLPNGSALPAEAVSMPLQTIAVPNHTKAGKARERAPEGFLQAAVLRIMAKSPGSVAMVRDLKKALRAENYPYPVGHLPKVVRQMAKDGLLSFKPNGPWSTYKRTAKAVKT